MNKYKDYAVKYVKFLVNNIIKYSDTITNFINIIPYIYFNLHNKNIYLFFILNSVKVYHIYNNISYYVEKSLDIILLTKLFIKKYIKYIFVNNKFKIKKVILYTDLNTNYNVTKYFMNNNIKKIDKNLILNIYSENIINFENNLNIRLKINFYYNEIEYIIYFPYNNLHDKLLNKNIDIENNYYIPFPIYSEEIIESYKKDIVLPYYNKNININSKNIFYSFFQMETKDIGIVKINDIENNDLINYFKMIKTPFNDFGLLYNIPVKLIWILSENNIDINTFNLLYFKFSNPYFCDIEYDIKDHFIKMTKNDLENIFISKRMENIILTKNDTK